MLQSTPPYMPQESQGLFSGLRLPGRGGGGVMRRRPQAENLGAPQLQQENTPRPADSLNIPNRDMPQNQDQAVINASGGAQPVFDPMTDPMIQRILAQQKEIEDLQSESNMMEDAYQPSKMRNILGTMAGIGTGALTMNPLIGMGMRDQIVKAPLRDAQRQNSQEIAQRQGNQKALGEVSGLQATLSQRNSQADEARAAGQNAQTNTRNAATNATKTQYEIDHPEVSTETFVAPGDTEASVQQVPKRAGTGVAPKKLGGAKPEAGQFQVETSADGKSMVQINKTTGETMQLTLPPGTQLNAQQVSDMAKYVNQSITEKPGTSPKAAMDEYLSRSRPNFGLATGEAARAAGDADTTEAETTTATISAAIAKLGIKDPTEAYNRFNDTLDKLLARRPELAKNADKIRAAGKAKYPGAGRAPSKSNPIDFGKALDDKKPTPGTK